MSSNSQTSNKARYVVIQLTGGVGPCKIVAEGEVYLAIYSEVYGPASYAECEAWIAQYC